MRVSFISIAAVAVSLSPCHGFLNLPFVNQANPAVTGYAEAQESALLSFHLDIGEGVDARKNGIQLTGDRLGVNGLLVELRGKVGANCEHPKLPGANGPDPQLSSGAKTLEVIQEGKIIDLTGTRHANLQHGVWEMIWRKDANAGAMICAFDVPEDLKRNGAMIPKGRLYMSFPVWTEETLRNLRERKVKAEERAVEAMDRLREETRMIRKTDNPLAKALHFRNACKASEDLDYSGHRNYQRMPLERDMINLNDGLHLCSVGTVWTKKNGGFFGNSHVLLGSVIASLGNRELTEKKVLSERELKSVAFDGLRP